MLKNILSLFICLFIFQVAQAKGPDSLIFYFNKSGNVVQSKDSAGYYRVILPPDTNIDKDLYRVHDYYSNGKLKRTATSFNTSRNLILDGICIEFFRNGNRKSIISFKNGRVIGNITNYYPNGKVYNVLKIDDNFGARYDLYNSYYPDFDLRFSVEFIEMRDSTGNVLAANGTGHIIIYDSDFKKIIVQGDMEHNKKEGDWIGPIADSGRFVCTFHKNELKEGVSYMNSGNRYTFKQVITYGQFTGDVPFQDFIKRNLQYPESAKKHKIEGSVIIDFYLETNGTVSNVRVGRGLFKSLDDEALRVIRLSPLWIPATAFGIPFRSYQTIAVNFYNM
jgi:TonB family protein